MNPKLLGPAVGDWRGKSFKFMTGVPFMNPGLPAIILASYGRDWYCRYRRVGLWEGVAYKERSTCQTATIGQSPRLESWFSRKKGQANIKSFIASNSHYQ